MNKENYLKIIEAMKKELDEREKSIKLEKELNELLSSIDFENEPFELNPEELKFEGIRNKIIIDTLVSVKDGKVENYLIFKRL